MQTKCSICGGPAVGRGFCKKHYRAFMKHGDPMVRANLRGVPFEMRYQIDGDCWLWIGSTNTSGYGIFTEGGERTAHRVSYKRYRGPIPPGMHVRHTCDCPQCVNPDHLVLGTHADNMGDLRERGRAYRAPGAANMAAKLTEDQALAVMQDARTCEAIALEYGISPATVDSIRNGHSWKHLFDESLRKARHAAGRRRLTEQERVAIAVDPRTQHEIAAAYGVSQTSVSVIKRKHV